jgi:hypothetical protein
MKKIFLFAAAAALLTACSSDELASVETAQQNADGAPINFSVYTPRNVTRAGAAGALDNANIGTVGFGVFAYYTDDETYNSESSKPDFMYNTQVTKNGTKWEYNPVMYWPNEFGTGANSTNTDYVSFFTYAPYIDVVNETGIPVLEEMKTDAEYDAYAASLGIKYVKYETKTVKDRATYVEYKGIADTEDAIANAWNFDNGTSYTGADYTTIIEPLIEAPLGTEYYLGTATPVTDLTTYQEYLGVATVDEAKAALDELWKEQVQGKNITKLPKNTDGGDPVVKYVVDTNPATSVDLLWGVAANATDYKSIVANTNVQNAVDMPFVNMIKPANPVDSKLNWNLKHALSKLNVNIQYVADQQTPTAYATTDAASEEINSNETRIYVRYVKIGGFVMKGALNLNNTTAGEPLWKSYDGQTSLAYTTTTFNDGRKDGKEGTYNGLDKNEENAGLNPDIVENYSKAIWPSGKTSGVTNKKVNLFAGGEPTTPIFVIPTGEDIDIEICYDVETKDASLAGFLSDGLTHGSTTQNIISKTSDKIFGAATPMEPGKGYNINIILGMTSVKFEAVVVPWDEPASATDVELPSNVLP